jgi:hypothetical protein
MSFLKTIFTWNGGTEHEDSIFDGADVVTVYQLRANSVFARGKKI